jgi:dephospho-CoA kinase
MIIGICGKSGSGKSTLSRMFLDRYSNAVHLEIDKVGHYVLTLPEVQEELVKAFGVEVLNEGRVDRKRLGNIVFDSRLEMGKLTEITWKYMQIEIDRFLEEHKDNIVVLDWLLLANSKYFDMCDVRILLDIPYEVRKERAMKRDGISGDAFDLREQASVDYDGSLFDYVIKDNNEIDIQRMVKKI